MKESIAVVVGGRYLVQFEKNPLVMNPFTYGAYVLDNDNRRGVSPLYSIYDIALSHETMIRKTMDLESLNENPPMLAGKGFFGDDADDIEVYPGKIVEYDNALYTTGVNTPKQIKTVEYPPAVVSQKGFYVIPKVTSGSKNNPVGISKETQAKYARQNQRMAESGEQLTLFGGVEYPAQTNTGTFPNATPKASFWSKYKKPNSGIYSGMLIAINGGLRFIKKDR